MCSAMTALTVVDSGKLTGIDNQVDPTTGTLKLKAEFPNGSFQLWPGQFVNVRLKVETISQALVVPTSAVQRGPVGAFSYVIGDGDIVTAKPVTVTQQNETQAVIASGLSANDRVVTTGFANLSDGAKVIVGKEEQTPVRRPCAAQEGQPRSAGQGWHGEGWHGRRMLRQRMLLRQLLGQGWPGQGWSGPEWRAPQAPFAKRGRCFRRRREGAAMSQEFVD